MFHWQSVNWATVLAYVVTFLTGAFGLFLGWFKLYGEKTVSIIFDKKLEAYKGEQAAALEEKKNILSQQLEVKKAELSRDLEAKKSSLSASLDRSIKLNQIELEVLPEVWSLIQDVWFNARQLDQIVYPPDDDFRFGLPDMKQSAKAQLVLDAYIVTKEILIAPDIHDALREFLNDAEELNAMVSEQVDIGPVDLEDFEKELKRKVRLLDAKQANIGLMIRQRIWMSGN